jgi:hypothetical protein
MDVEQYKTDACLVSEIINDMDRSLLSKTEKAGFADIKEVKQYHAATVGAEY